MPASKVSSDNSVSGINFDYINTDLSPLKPGRYIPVLK